MTIGKPKIATKEQIAAIKRNGLNPAGMWFRTNFNTA